MYNEYDENPVHKTLKQRKKKVKFEICIMFVMMIFAFLLSDFSKIKSTNIYGLETKEEKDVLNHISIERSSYYFLTDKKKVEKGIKEIPTIKDVKVHMD